MNVFSLSLSYLYKYDTELLYDVSYLQTVIENNMPKSESNEVIAIDYSNHSY